MSKDAQVLDQIETGLQLMLSGMKKLRAAEDWVDQYHSPLGKGAHLAAVRRGDLIGHRVPGSRGVFVKRADLDRYITSHRVQPSQVADVEADTRDEATRVADLLAYRAPRPRRAKKATAA